MVFKNNIMKKSAGVLLYKFNLNQLFVFLIHPGGPFWKNKDAGTWSIPKGEYEDEIPLTAAIREFKEETGFDVSGKFTELSPVKLKSGKLVIAFACEGNIEADKIQSNTFSMEWPPKSGKIQSFPEVDKGAWFTLEEARVRINVAQVQFLDDLEGKLSQR